MAWTIFKKPCLSDGVREFENIQSFIQLRFDNSAIPSPKSIYQAHNKTGPKFFIYKLANKTIF